MAKANSDVDLFGDPITLRQGGRGRPSHAWSRENSNKVLLAFVRGLNLKQAAMVIGVSVPTLREHYSSEIAKRKSAQLRMEMTQLARLNAQAEAGNVTAEKELIRQLDRFRSRDQAQAMASRPPKPPKLGKKAEAEQKAAQQRGLYEPPPAPGQLN